MSRNKSSKLRSVLLTAIVVTSLLSTTIVGPASAEAGNVSVGSDVVQSDATITVSGDVSSENAGVAILIQDPTDDDYVTVTKDNAGDSNGDFSVDIDLGSRSFSGGDDELDEGDATIAVNEGDNVGEADETTTVTIDDTPPSATLTNPEDGADRQTEPWINGTASDENDVASVELMIQKSDGNYYNGDGWSRTKTTVDANGATDWSYNTTSEGITSDGTYDVTVKVTDSAGNSVEETYPYPGAESSLTEITYTVDSKAPDLSNVAVTDATDNNGTVEDGDTVEVSATVTDPTSGVDTVTVDASALGAGENVTLTQDSGNDYSETITVDGPTAGEGDFDLPVTATDNFGNEVTERTGELYLDTSVANVGQLTVDHEFAGIVKDDEELRVTASDITDPQGNNVTDATVDIEFVGPGTTYEADITDGSLSKTVDTTAIANKAETGDTKVRIKQAADGEASAFVDLVHEANGLDGGYQMQGTPMPAVRTVTQDVDLVTTWDPEQTSETKWTSPSTETAGEGYYVHGNNSNARIGYVFETSVTDDEQHQTRNLAEGYNLVGATEQLTTSSDPTVTQDLGAMITFDGNDNFDGNGNVNVSIRDSDEPLSNGDSGVDQEAFDVIPDPGTQEVDGFDAYFVYVADGDVTRIVDRYGYEPADG